MIMEAIYKWLVRSLFVVQLFADILHAQIGDRQYSCALAGRCCVVVRCCGALI